MAERKPNDEALTLPIYTNSKLGQIGSNFKPGQYQEVVIDVRGVAVRHVVGRTDEGASFVATPEGFKALIR